MGALIESTSGRNESLLSSLWKEKQNSLQRLCLRWTGGNTSEAEDLLSEAFLRAIEVGARNADAIQNPHAWLATIISNLARDRLRQRRRVSASGGTLEPHCPYWADQEEVLGAKRTLSLLRGRLSDLGEAQREALLSRGFGDEYDEIASALETTTSNARKLVQLGRRQLRSPVGEKR